ncbi:MAG: helix-turn-helix domain-containing protein [Selenomonadaceae bacterium]|nr:helix-turn-helix domain-containing protein [Selenomonadaceae bacterium]
MKVSEALRRFRKRYGLTQADVANTLGVTQQSYQPYEVGKMLPGAKILIKIATTYGVTTDYLLGLSDKPHPVFNEEEVREAFEFRDTIQKAVRLIMQPPKKPKEEIHSKLFDDEEEI